MDAMDDNSQLLAIYFDINAKNLVQHRKVTVPDVAPSLQGLQQGMVIWHMKNASREGHQSQTDRKS